ncbi:MAG: hypothetical protein ACMUHM_01545 [Thermoplasmatota archaeon]
MIDVIKVIYLLLITSFFYFLVIRLYIKKEPFGRKEWVLTLLVLGLSIVLYVRFVINDLILIAPSDEALYVDLAADVTAGQDAPTSGPGFLYAVLLVCSMTGWPVENIIAISGLLLGSAYPLIIYLIYRKHMASREEAVFSLIFIFSTSYLLWPMIEARPQQAGMLLVLVGGLLYHLYLDKGKHMAPVILICLFTFFWHVLSFLILMGLIFLLWWFAFLEDRTNIRKIVWPFIISIFGLFIFIAPIPLYSGMYGGIRYTLDHSSLSIIRNRYFLTAFIVVSLPVLVLLTRYLKKIDIVDRLKRTGVKYSKILMIIFISILILGLCLQFYLNREIHIEKYRGSFLLFLILQSGNFFFGAMFMIGFFRSMGNNNFQDPYFRSVIMLMLIGIGSLVISIFLPIHFNNWAIRMINYWTLFAAPLVARQVLIMDPKWRKVLILILPLFIVLSLINISRDPTILGFP